MYFSEPPKDAPGLSKGEVPLPICKNMPVAFEVAQNYRKSRIST